MFSCHSWQFKGVPMTALHLGQLATYFEEQLAV